MQILITGKNIDVGDALRRHVTDRFETELKKYFDGVVRVNVTIEKHRSGFKTECSLHLSTGLTLQARGHGADAYGCFDAASAHLEKRLRRYTRRLKNHHQSRKTPVQKTPAASYVIAPDDEAGESAAPDGLNPVVIAEDTRSIAALSVGEAVMELDISDLPFVLFRNEKSGGLNVVYRREDGHIGWVDPGDNTAVA